jgi:hypothetical protein
MLKLLQIMCRLFLPISRLEGEKWTQLRNQGHKIKYPLYILHIMLQSSNIILTRWWLLFQNLNFSRIEVIDLHNLAVKKASSLLLMPLDYFYQITCKYIPMVLLLHLKAKGSWYVSNVSIIFDAPCLLIHHFLCVLLHFVVFLCIFRN